MGVAKRHQLSPSEVRLIRDNFTYEDNGYDNEVTLENTLTLTTMALKEQNSTRNGGWNNYLVKVWESFSMFETFSQRYGCMHNRQGPWKALILSSHDQLWNYDTALTNYLPKRALLVGPKPAYAFGLELQEGSEIWDKVCTLPEITMPSVDSICASAVTAPFLILESKSNYGNIRTGENQLCNAMVKAHDILNSLNLQTTCFILGVVQVEYHARLYMSVSSQACDGRIRYTDRVCEPPAVVTCNADSARYTWLCLTHVIWQSSMVAWNSWSLWNTQKLMVKADSGRVSKMLSTTLYHEWSKESFWQSDTYLHMFEKPSMVTLLWWL